MRMRSPRARLVPLATAARPARRQLDPSTEHGQGRGRRNGLELRLGEGRCWAEQKETEAQPHTPLAKLPH